MSTEWHQHRVMVHHGATDTRKGSKRPYETRTLAEVFEMLPDSQPKNRALAMLQSRYNAPDGRTHDVQQKLGSFVVLAMDIDEGDKSLDEVVVMVAAFVGEGVAWRVYSSSSAKEGNRKWRVIVMLESAVPYPPWYQAINAFFNFAEGRGFVVDHTLARAGQPVYLPNVPPNLRGADGEPLFFQSRVMNGRGLRITELGLAAQTLQVAQHSPLADNLRKLQNSAPPGPIERFNAAHRLEDLMVRYGYIQSPRSGVDWRSPLQTSESYATRIFTGNSGEQYWVSQSESDATAGLGREAKSGVRTGDAFDLFCYFEHGGDARVAQNALEASQEALEGLEGDPKALDWGALPEHPPAVPFVIPSWLPAGVVTLFAAHGGTGKSFLSVCLAICIATGRHPFEPGTALERRAKVILYSAEDGMLVLQTRIIRYLQWMDLEPSELEGWLEVLDATSSNNVLYAASRSTPRLIWLREHARRVGAEVLIFDNASDGFSGNEIDRAQVRQFMTALRTVAPTVLLLAHVDAASSRADPSDAKGYSGSTAWHNSARSRWFMSRDKKTGEIVLQHAKVNYGRSGSQVIVVWDELHGLYRVSETLKQARKPEDYRGVLLRLLAETIDGGGVVRPQPNSPDSTFKTLQHLPGFPPRLTQAEVNREVGEWLKLGLVRREADKRANRHQAERLVLTDKGLALAEPAPDPVLTALKPFAALKAS